MKLNLKQKLIEKGLTNEERRRIENAPIHLNSAGMDDWGLDPQTLQAGLAAFRWIYRDYFRVETVGIENVPQGRVLLIANHGGQLPWDGILIGMSMLLDAKHTLVLEKKISAVVLVSHHLTDAHKKSTQKRE